MREYSLRFDNRSEILDMLHIQRTMLFEQQSLIDEFIDMINQMDALREEADCISAAAGELTEAFNTLQEDADMFIQNTIRAKECKVDRDLFRRSLRVSFLYSEKISNQINDIKNDLYKMSQVLKAVDNSLGDKD